MSRPRTCLVCPICKCYADHVYFREKDAWRCTFCRQYYAVAPVLAVVVAHQCNSGAESELGGESTLEPGWLRLIGGAGKGNLFS